MSEHPSFENLSGKVCSAGVWTYSYLLELFVKYMLHVESYEGQTYVGAETDWEDGRSLSRKQSDVEFSDDEWEALQAIARHVESADKERR